MEKDEIALQILLKLIERYDEKYITPDLAKKMVKTYNTILEELQTPGK